MPETLSSQRNHNTFIDQIEHNAFTYMRDIETAEGYPLPPDPENPDSNRPIYTAKESLELAEWAKNRNGDFTDVLKSAGWHKGEYTDEEIKMLELLLRTPRFIYAYAPSQEDRSSLEGNPVLELTEYRALLREAIKANSELSADELIQMLIGTAVLHLPESYRHKNSEVIERAVHGARGEGFVEDLARQAGITCRAATPEDDAKGIDLRLTVPVRKRGEELEVELPVDVKFLQEQIPCDPGEISRRFRIVKDGKAVMLWHGVPLRELKNRLVLDEATIERNAPEFAYVVTEAAKQFAAYQRVAPHIGNSARRYA